MSDVMWELIARINKWWIDPESIRNDDHVRKFDESTVKWVPKIFSPDDIVDGVYTLRGPRQVGKTTILKLFIRGLLEKGLDPNSIIYIPCDALRSYNQLLELLMDVRRRLSGRLIMILDEVTLIDEWQRAVKVFVDSGFLRNTTIIACGSHAVDVKKGATYLVGRRGSAKYPIDRTMLTITFREYVSIMEPRFLMGVRSLRDILSMNPMRRETLISHLYDIFMKYLRTGGFPRVIDEYNKRGFISKTTMSDFVNYLSRDITRLNKSETIARALMHAIIKQRCNPTSWNSIARELGISQPTIREYGELLSQMYLVRPIYHPNRTFTGSDERRDKKLIFRDSFIYHLGSLWALGFPEIDIEPKEIIMENLAKEQQHIVEMVVLEHIARRNMVYYWKPRKELDAIIIEKEGVVGVEVKWKEKISRSEIRDIIRTYNKIPLKRKFLIIVTKHSYSIENNVLLIPAPLLLITKELAL